LTEDDVKPGAPRVAVISYSFWSRRFGREASAVGAPVAINGLPFTIVGIAPPEFFGVNSGLVPDFWAPLREEPAMTPWGVQPDSGQSMFSRHWWWVMIVGRLTPGTSAEQARVELDPLFQQSITAGLSRLPKTADLPHIELAPANENLNFLRSRFSQPLKILMAAVALVLLIACANVATLLLARAAARQKEMSIRLATGAGRARLIRQLLTESLLLSTAGGLLGLLLARWGSQALVLLITDPGENAPLNVEPDAMVLGFTAAISFITGILFGLAPAVRATRVDVAGALKKMTRAASARMGPGNALIAGQVALSLLLVADAGLFMRTLRNLESQDLGFDRSNILVFGLDPRRGGGQGARLAGFYQAILERLQTLPGVQSATASQLALMTGWVNSSSVATDGAPTKSGDSEVYWNGVGPAFLETMRIPLVFGRGIGWPDVQSGREVAVVNEAFARAFYPGQNPLGRHFNFGDTRNTAEEVEIIGVSANARYDRLRGKAPRTVYVPYTAGGAPGRMHLELRTAGDPAGLVPAVRAIVRGLYPDLPLLEVKTESEQIEESLQQERMFAGLSSFFAALALLPVATGLSGTLAYAVTRRTSEIGIRMALGAQRQELLWMILRQSLRLIAWGVAAGLPAALAATRLVQKELYGVKANDPATLAVTVLVLAVVGLLAGYLPARRASRVEPTIALRYE